MEIETTRPLFLDPYAAQRSTGSFILIDPVSHATVAAGMVREIINGQPKRVRQRSPPAPSATLLYYACRNGADRSRRGSAAAFAGQPNLLQRLSHAGVVVLIEAENLEDFSHEVSIARPWPPALSSRSPVCQKTRGSGRRRLDRTRYQRRRRSAMSSIAQIAGATNVLPDRIAAARDLVNQQVICDRACRMSALPVASRPRTWSWCTWCAGFLPTFR